MDNFLCSLSRVKKGRVLNQTYSLYAVCLIFSLLPGLLHAWSGLSLEFIATKHRSVGASIAYAQANLGLKEAAFFP